MIQSFYHEFRLDEGYGELVKSHRQSYARLARLKFICEYRENSFLVFTLTLAKDFLNSVSQISQDFSFSIKIDRFYLGTSYFK